MMLLNLMLRHGSTRDHCDFKRLDKNGKCTALCSQNTGDHDCAGVKHETINQYQDRVAGEGNLH
jgi:hypothetical protein